MCKYSVMYYYLCILFCFYTSFSSANIDHDRHTHLMDYGSHVGQSGFIGRDNYVSHLKNRDYEFLGDGHEDMVHPCPTSDLDCIRHFFAQNSDCVPRRGPAPDPLVIHWQMLPIPHANITYIVNEAYVSSLNEVKVKEFYVNKATGNLIMELDMPFRGSCDKCIMRYHVRRGEHEDRVHYAALNMNSYSTTLVVPVYRGVQMSRRQLYHYFKHTYPPFVISPSAVSSDPELHLAFLRFLTRFDITLREGFEVLGAVYFDAYFNNHVCDFSLQRPAFYS